MTEADLAERFAALQERGWHPEEPMTKKERAKMRPSVVAEEQRPESLDERAWNEAAQALVIHGNAYRDPEGPQFEGDEFDYMREVAERAITTYLASLPEQGPPLDEYRSELHRAIGLAQSLSTAPVQSLDNAEGVRRVAAEIVALLEALAEQRKASG